MLPKCCHEIEDKALPTITQKADGRDVTDRRAFPAGTVLELCAEIPQIGRASCRERVSVRV